MKKSERPKVQEINNSLKDKIRAIDFTGMNFFEKNYSLVMDNSPVVKYFAPDAPLHSSEHRVLLVKKGSVDYSLNFMNFHVSEGDLLLVPANFIIEIEEFTPNFNARVLTFRFSDMVDTSLVGFDVIHLKLGQNEYQVFEGFFQMMHRVLTTPTSDRRDFEHLVLSMLFRIQDIYAERYGKQKPIFGDRKQQVFSKFMQLVSQADDKLPRSVGAYAEPLGVPNNYLSVIVKEISDRTVMEWVDIKTVMIIKAKLSDPTGPTVDQIAYQLGFSSSSQMIRVFKKLTGKTPLEYRKERSKVQKKKHE